MTTLLLVRHGRTTANASGVLAGWTPGVGLDDTGRTQVAALAERVGDLPLAAVVTSPLQRCRETAEPLLAAHPERRLEVDDDLGEVRYGDWTGQTLKSLAKDPLWKVVQGHPSAAVFPGDDAEGLATMQARAVATIRSWNRELGPDAVYVAVSHGDVIKAILADALGTHLDQFQRIVVDPASVSVINYTATRPFVLRVNDTGAALDGFGRKKRGRRSRRTTSDAVVGGGAGEGS